MREKELLLLLICVSFLFLLAISPQPVHAGAAPAPTIINVSAWEIGTTHTPGQDKTGGTLISVVVGDGVCGPLLNNYYYRVEIYVGNNGPGDADYTTSKYLNLTNLQASIDISGGDVWFVDGGATTEDTSATFDGTDLSWSDGPYEVAGEEDMYAFIMLVGSTGTTTSGATFDLYELSKGTDTYAYVDFNVADTIPPTYSDAGHNTTIAGDPVLFYIKYDDNVALHPSGQWIFSTNNTGTWVNDSAVNWTATPEWANVSKTLNSTAGVTIGYRWYAFDNAGKWNSTPIYTLTTTEAGYVAITVSPADVDFGIVNLGSTNQTTGDAINATNTGTATGAYTANVTMYYDGKSVSSTGTFSIVSPPPPPAVVGGGGISPPIIPPLEALLKFLQLPVLQEVRPGETVRTKIFIHNPTADDFGELVARISIAGVPEDWVTILPEILSLGPRGSQALDIILTIPADARAGDYKVGIDISNKRIEAENFFILRVNPHPPGYDKPSVTRIVNIDKSRGNTLISLEVKNTGNFIEEVEIIEEIPKEIAQTVEQIEFSIPPTEILEADPVVKWIIEDLQPYEARTISYRVPVILDEYSAYVYWPVKQTSIIYEKPPELIEVSRISTPELFPGTTEEISIGLRNLDTKPVNLTAKLELPVNWGITPNKIVTTIPPRDSSTLSFLVTPPSQAVAGTHTITLRISYDGREFTVDSTAIVKHPSWIHLFLTYLLELVLALTIIVVVVFIILILRGKFMERGRRRGGISLLKLKQEMKKR